MSLDLYTWKDQEDPVLEMTLVDLPEIYMFTFYLAQLA